MRVPSESGSSRGPRSIWRLSKTKGMSRVLAVLALGFALATVAMAALASPVEAAEGSWRLLREVSLDTRPEIDGIPSDDVLPQAVHDFPAQREGRHQAYLDRIDLPRSLAGLPNVFEEAVDDDGIRDYFIAMDYIDGSHGDSSLSQCRTVGSYVTLAGYNCISLGVYNSEDEAMAASDALLVTFIAFQNDHPEVFWLNDYIRYSVFTFSGSGTTYVSALMLGNPTLKNAERQNHVYNESYRTEAELRRDLALRESRIGEILATASGATTGYAKVRAFHDWLTTHNAYNTDVTAGIGDPVFAHECLSALVGATGREGPVCDGYSKALKVLCDRSGIPCVIVCGVTDTGGSHAWNAVHVGDGWYAVDATWDDPSGSGADEPRSGSENWDYFLVGSDTSIAGRRFGETHREMGIRFVDQPNVGLYPNGPLLSSEAYVPGSSPTVESIADARIVVADVTYTGEPQRPPMTVTLDGLELVEGIDYRVEYLDNVDAGRGRVIATGLGGYGGTASQTFTIAKAARTLAADPSSVSLEVDGTADVAVTGGEGAPLTAVSSAPAIAEARLAGSTLTVTGRAKGSAVVTVACVEDANHLAATIQVPVTVTEVPTVTIWRLCNPWTGEHIFTNDLNEYRVQGAGGWIQEGPAWKSPVRSSTPIYRLYNRYSGDHHYTTSKGEYDRLERAGWQGEGIKLYSDDGRQVPVYRLFNPNVSAGTHHYTIDSNEYRSLCRIGWRGEGTGWYGCPL